MSVILDEAYWTSRYKSGQTGWDAGSITTPLKSYFDQLENKSCRILIPGAGNAHEAGYLYENGYCNVYIADLSLEPLNHFGSKYPDFPPDQILHADFFDLNGSFDLIIEQTFFCAIDRRLRLQYARKCHELLKVGGKIVGLLWKDEWAGGPPFGGSISEYEELFQPYFSIKALEEAHNSIKPRVGRELFVILEKV